ncbi:hypothetical protein [Gaoshiqia sediminis]|uniref:Uncharacterized protein n=1 Tax=Gaoshiqia sediminis TaxID=2986998 RepID=A0AA42C8K7_9BACT|nr:hypothetical protein [Gaoshiqia sediminis]MCW0484834.1 hypothetical protein [Gaoshiqia sediminis]
MKTRILSFLIVALGLMVSTSAFAQNETSVQRMATHTYTVTPSNGNGSFTYKWSIEAGGTTTDISTDTDASITVQWDGVPETYTITVQATDANLCLSEEITLDVTIESPEVEFTASNLTGSTCSHLGVEGSGNTGAASDNDILEYTLAFTGGNPDFSLVYDIYDITSGGAGGAGGTVVKANQPATFDALTGTLAVTIDSDFENNTATSKTYEIRIVSAQDADGTTVTVGTDKYATITIYSKPVIAF